MVCPHDNTPGESTRTPDVRQSGMHVFPTLAQCTLHARAGEHADVSTQEVHALLSDGVTLVVDARPYLEWCVGHIPGAVNVAPKPGVSMSEYVGDVAEIARLSHGDLDTPILIYCNGPFCGKTDRLQRELRAAGFRNVRCYRLGVPVWRALGGVLVMEPDGVRHIASNDRTAWWIDTRPHGADTSVGIVSNARITPGEVTAAKDDGRLPMNDHNTRVIVYGDDPHDARSTAEEIARNAFHNVTYFVGTTAGLDAAVRPRSATQEE